MTADFSPFIPWPYLAVLAVAAAILAALGIWRGVRGAWVRAAALAAFCLALANPILFQEEREPLSTIVAVVVDRSQSQDYAGRREQTDKALADLKDRLSRFPQIETRIVEAADSEESEAPSTRLFSALTSVLADVPPARVGGAIFITDGQIHDVPDINQKLGFDAPIHGLISGKPDEFDRRIEIVSAPRFGIVGEQQKLSFRVVDDGAAPGGTAQVTIRLNGNEIATEVVEPGTDVPFSFTVPRGGNNILEFAVNGVPGEVTETNNRAVHVLDGIRENLRVLLVSGEPHAGERAWRNLLKSDAAVDLVHFTILRPPEKQDGTPINELSLIAFPTRELFVDKISEFDLIIFDRYQHRGVLPILYYDNIAQYVQNGGALLIAAGPEHAGNDSIAATPLSAVLPANPTGVMNEKGFYPRLSDEGKKHPVTRGLEGAASEPPQWGRWFRTVDVDRPLGQTVMEAADGKPLLVLNRVGKGRVAMLLSDQGWLWARGFEGGGPHVSLYRRTAHWLMQEPALEEEALTARAAGRTLEITRQTIEGDPGHATLTYPSGKTEELTLAQREPGLYSAEIKTTETGLFEVANDELTTLVHVGNVDAPEFRAAISTEDKLRPWADKTKGLVRRLASADGAIDLPSILPVRGAVRVADDQRLSLRMTDETVLRGINSLSLFTGLFGLAVLLFLISATWYREGR
ncbi:MULTISPECIES: membrane protein [Ensifer]|jgi:hypothetical protein|uniref:Glutamine amidotransferase domain-containing protein n=1 Tax=Ensifer canadensis TaxID=555315 RepID=A0AAW4FSR9_9HYPH|nr:MULTISPECIES: membrane protein [Ensifer]AHK45068.1 putative transmembrane protein [Ensifer adhaerens OV14]MDP9630230.1 hypothetical protein [Ensifer adhaerens]KQW53974.1 hypothetical protein ASD02_31450 [Ensifer sp. Root1252]KQW83333.1 hypothetical protein ASD03_21845 [Ensifer sp. Root127]KQY68844.1 hypothetical protein ASD52_33175 [Ensifer sp. Root142]